MGATGRGTGVASTPVTPDATSAPHTGRTAALGVVLAGVAGVVVLLTSVVGPVQVASAGMEPTLRAGDVVLVDRRAVAVEDLDRGDLVTLANPGSGTGTTKRVVGLPGDRVVLRAAALDVNGVRVEEPYLDDAGRDRTPPVDVRVPEGSVYVLGDNRAWSVDSRDFGPVDADALDGRVMLRLWPPPGRRATDVAADVG